MQPFKYWNNRDESIIEWGEVSDAVFRPQDTREASVSILEATDSEFALRLYVVPESKLSDVLRGALRMLDEKRFDYADCLRDPEMAAAALRVLNAMGALDDAPGLLSQVTEHFVKDVTRAFSRARPRDREQVPHIIAGMKDDLPSADELTEMKNVWGGYYAGTISDGDVEWRFERPELCEARVTSRFIYNLMNPW